MPWELFRGQLLPPSQSRGRATFDTWNIYRVDDTGQRSDEPLLSLKLDRRRQVVHVTRAIHCHAWEGYHAGDNVYLSRETPRWLNELVGSVDLRRYSRFSRTHRRTGRLALPGGSRREPAAADFSGSAASRFFAW